MLAVGRRRTKDLHLMRGVREIDGMWYWQPSSESERVQRRKLKAEAKKRGEKFSIGCTLGPANSKEARTKWAEVSGYRDVPTKEGTVAELFKLYRKAPDGLPKKRNGKPRSKNTIREYTASLKLLEARYGDCRYAKTAGEAMDGKALGTAQIQQFVAEGGRPMENRHLSAFSAAFDWAIRKGLTAYNPCLGVAKNAEEPRTREALEWEVEVLRAMAYATQDKHMALMIDYEDTVGWRVSDILTFVTTQVYPGWIKHRHGKRGKKQRWERTPEVERILREAATLPGANIERLGQPRYVFPTRSGEQMSLGRFEKRWSKLKKRTNAALAACEIQLKIEDLHFQDLRSKVHDDAEDQGQEGHEVLGNSEEVADRHYGRRGKMTRPNK